MLETAMISNIKILWSDIVEKGETEPARILTTIFKNDEDVIMN